MAVTVRTCTSTCLAVRLVISKQQEKRRLRKRILSFLRRINELQKKRFSCKFRKITIESHLRHKAHSPQDALDTLTFWIGLIFPATSNRSRGGLACIQENSQYIPAHPKHTSGEWKKNEKSIQVTKTDSKKCITSGLSIFKCCTRPFPRLVLFGLFTFREAAT